MLVFSVGNSWVTDKTQVQIERIFLFLVLDCSSVSAHRLEKERCVVWNKTIKYWRARQKIGPVNPNQAWGERGSRLSPGFKDRTKVRRTQAYSGSTQPREFCPVNVETSPMFSLIILWVRLWLETLLAQIWDYKNTHWEALEDIALFDPKLSASFWDISWEFCAAASRSSSTLSSIIEAPWEASRWDC